MRRGIIDEMKVLGYRFSGTGGGRIYFDGNGLRREFKSWDDVLAFVESRACKGKEC